MHHDSPVGGHLGLRPKANCDKFYWIHSCCDTEEWSYKYDLCDSKKGLRAKHKSPLYRRTYGMRAQLGPLPETECGNKYILIAMNYFSRV